MCKNTTLQSLRAATEGEEPPLNPASNRRNARRVGALALGVGVVLVVVIAAAMSKERLFAAWTSSARGQSEPSPEPSEAVSGDHSRASDDADELRFNRDIRPVLSDRCFQCHGFDEVQRKAGLRLDTFEGATQALESGRQAIVPGDPSRSEMIRRLRTDDPGDQMPPPSSHLEVSAEEIRLLEQWIESGAEYRQHWSFGAPIRPNPAVTKASLPSALAEWATTPIDTFVALGYVRNQLSPNPPAPPLEWLRRVTLDLTGVPPTPEEQSAFEADSTEAGRVAVVDRLLDSPRYGEHFARTWLDAARYGDTHGLHLDNERTMWKYRDWVVDAFQNNLSFDEFTIWQLAGDLLPSPTTEQLVATGFNRCHVTTSEGGAINAEYLAKYAMDRVDTFGTVWLGLTLGCAQCHDHKYDPITQRDYYEIFAFFNNTAEAAMDGNAKLPAPIIPVPSPKQSSELESMRAEVDELAAALLEPIPAVDQSQKEWEASERTRLGGRWEVLREIEWTSDGETEFSALDDGSYLAGGPAAAKEIYEARLRTEISGGVAIRVELLTDSSLVGGGPGRAPNGNAVLTEIEAESISVRDPTHSVPVRFQDAWADLSQEDYPVAQAIDGEVATARGWAIDGHRRHQGAVAVFTSKAPFGHPGGTELVVRLRFDSIHSQHSAGRIRLSISSDTNLAGSVARPWSSLGPIPAQNPKEAFLREIGPERRVDLHQRFGDLKWTPQPSWADGRVHALTGGTGSTYLYRDIDVPEPRHVRFFLGSDDGARLWLNGKEIFSKDVPRGVAPDQDKVTAVLRPGRNSVLFKISNYGGQTGFYFRMEEDSERLKVEQVLAGDQSLAGGDEPVLATETDPRSDDESLLLRRYYRRYFSPEWQALEDRWKRALVRRDAFEAALPRTLVAKERSMRRPAHLLIRGQYDQPGPRVEPGVPSALPPISAQISTPAGNSKPADGTRLSLARWLMQPDHPLTARVVVNRFWAHYFGRGIVATPDDFGAQGEWPTHPELLDYLATEFVAMDWDVKAFQKRIVLSTTYRQSRRMSPLDFEKDPDNRWLSRGPRLRMEAEALRDTALFVSGLLVETRGGRGVQPYQPEGVWEAVAYTSSNTAKYKRDGIEGLYRRSLYTFLKRTAPPANMSILDAPSREICVVRRERTNTPLAALVLLNDTQFVEAARVLADRLRAETDGTPAGMVNRAVRWVASRPPSEAERAELIAFYEQEARYFEANPKAALEFLSVGEFPAKEGFEPAQQAAWALVASVLLNWDEAIHR